MEKKEAIEIIIEATKGNARKEDFFKLPNEIIGDVLDEYAKGLNKNRVIPNVSDNDITDLLDELDCDATLYDCHSYGLPIHGSPQKDMIATVRDWLKKSGR